MYKIDIEEREFHFKQPARTSRGAYTERKSWLIHITDGDCHGIGECAPLPDLSCDALPHATYSKVLRQFCDQVEATGSIDYEAMRDYPSMLFGLETALQSLTGKAKGEEAAADSMLFDTPFGRGEEGIPINGLVWMGTFEEMRERIEQKLAQGFHCVKLKIGAIDFNQELELLKKIRSRYSRREIELRVDANGAFSPDDALQKLEQLSLYDIHSIEQPIRQGQWGDMAFLCRESPIPIALDEELIGVNDSYTKAQLLDIIKPAYIILKPSLHGGMAGTKEWIDLANDRHIGSWITSALESNVGLNAIAHLTAYLYGPHIQRPQGLGTGQLFTDNIPMPLEIIGDKLWYKQG